MEKGRKFLHEIINQAAVEKKLAILFQPIILTGCCPWTSDSRSNQARSIFFMTAGINTLEKITSSSMRALPGRTARLNTNLLEPLAK